jgi:hypothetical protein
LRDGQRNGRIEGNKAGKGKVGKNSDRNNGPFRKEMGKKVKSGRKIRSITQIMQKSDLSRWLVVQKISMPIFRWG